jgi:3-oxoacyl-[acyl-carrier protein] reductase
MQLDLDGKKILIAGASKGIGLATARGFATEGANVWMLARSPKRLENVMKELQKQFGPEAVKATQCDCSSSIEMIGSKKIVEREWKGIDVIVANVGDGRSTSEALPEAKIWAKTWQANFETAINTARTFIPLLTNGRGVLIFISSIAGLEAFGAPTDYSTAKSAVQALAKNLARKLAPQIRVNVIAPGNVYFPGGSWDQKYKANKSEVDEIIRTQVPMQRFATTDEIAHATIFLSSSRAQFITGATLTVDGGQTVGI